MNGTVGEGGVLHFWHYQVEVLFLRTTLFIYSIYSHVTSERRE